MEGRESLSVSSELRRPLLEGDLRDNDDDDEEEQAAIAILEEWNASVSAFVAENGGEDNLDCYCASIEPSPESEEIDDDDNDDNDNAAAASKWAMIASKLATIGTATLLPDAEPTLGSYSMASDDNNNNNNNNNNDNDNDNDDDEINDDNNNNNQGDERSSRRQRRRLVRSIGVIKFLKFVVITLGSIALVRSAVVAVGISDRDVSLTLQQIWMYEGDSILRDLAFFFVVGRMHHRTGVDTLEWLGFGLLANLYFESQVYFEWMQHSATPYEMHCLWPWKLWAFAILVVAGMAGLVVAHARVAHNHREDNGRLWNTTGELLLCAVFFVLPVVASPYAHFHHWFAGWFLGMHANLHHKWWSRATMAYCWGMYVNGIAVYGRDPLLTCDYALFLVHDQHCPIDIDIGGATATVTTMTITNPPQQDDEGVVGTASGLVPLLGDLLFQLLINPGGDIDGISDSPDWTNCSNSGYHP
jgi:hypothetical protein